MSDLDDLSRAAHEPPTYAPWRRPVAPAPRGAIAWAIGLLLIVAAVAWFLEIRPDQPMPSPVPTASVTAGELLADYGRNEVAADATYRGRLIIVRGTIAEIHRDLLDNAYVALYAEDGVRRVQCFFRRADEPDLVPLSPGMPVAIAGRCDGLMINVLVKDCRRVDTPGGPR